MTDQLLFIGGCIFMLLLAIALNITNWHENKRRQEMRRIIQRLNGLCEKGEQ